jgi:peptidoglycan/LPS O-acetylase OafA/YrhL
VPRLWPYRYELLDGLRGLAALAVVGTHLTGSGLGHDAVMLFFVISGYCIAAAAESCRRKGLSVREFMWRRLRRIYPPYFLSILFYALTRVAKLAIVGRNGLLRPWSVWLQNFTLTQWLSLVNHPVTDAAANHTLLVAAYWSLDYEEQFYLVIALALLLAVRRGVPVLACILALGAVGLAWNLAFPATLRGVFIEYWLHFSLGAMLFYVLCVLPQPAARTAFVAVIGGLFAYSLARVLPWHAQPGVAPRLWMDLAVASGFTLTLFFARPLSAYIARHPLWRPIAALGVISYSLYLVHQFNLTVASTAARRLAPHSGDLVRYGITIAVLLLIATLFWYCCERPFLNHRLAPQASSPAGGYGGTGMRAVGAEQ